MRLQLAVVLLVTLLCLAWAVTKLEWSLLLASVSAFSWPALVPVCACYLATHSLRVLRLRWILGRPIPFWPLMSIVSIGYLAINVMPFRFGEFVRPWMLSDRYQVPFGEGLAAILVERLVDMLLLLVMLWAVAFWVQLPEGALVAQGIDLLAAGQRFAGGIVAVGTLGLVFVAVAGERALVLTDRLPMGGLVRRLVEALRAFLRRPRELALILATSVVIWLTTLWAVQVSLAAADGLPWDFQSALVVWTATMFGMAAIPTPGFVGGFEAGCVAGLVVLGAAPEAATAFAVILHFGQFGFTVLWGLGFLLREGLSLRELVAKSRAELGA